MDIVKEVFKKVSFNKNKLIAYGFKQTDDHLHYERSFYENFKAVIDIDSQGEVSASVYDEDMDDEYLPVKNNSQNGEFVSTVRYHFLTLLEDIKANGFDKTYFQSPQANRIAAYIKAEFGDEALFLFKKDGDKDTGVFKDRTSGKWYGIIMNIDYRKLGIEKDGKVDIINVKLKPDMIDELITNDGFHRAYHMNKHYWLSLRLDETLIDEVIMSLVAKSHDAIAATSNEWIVPANPNWFDIFEYCDRKGNITWHRIKGIRPNDTIYLYITSPIKALMYRFKVLKADENGIIMKRERKYPKDRYPYSTLVAHGIKMVRGPRKVNTNLSELLKEEQ